MTPSQLVQAGRLSTRAIILMGLLNTLGAFSMDFYLSAFPALARDFHTDPSHVQLSLSVFVLGSAFGQLIYGPLVDRFGRRRFLLGGIALYSLSSLSLIFAPSIESFIALRLIQALGACAGMVITRAIIRDLFTDETEAARAFTMMMMVQASGPLVAPVLGGCLVSAFGWHSVFLFLTAYGALGIGAAYFFIPETLAPEARRHEDLLNIVRVYLRLLMTPPFILPALAGALTLSSLFAYLSASPFIYMGLFHITPFQYGWLFGFIALSLIMMGQINRLLLKRYKPRQVFLGGLIVSVISTAILLLMANTTHLALFVAPVWVTIAIRPAITANATAVAMAATGKHAGSGSALIGAMQFGLGALMATLVGIFDNGTATPMAALMFATSVAGLLVYWLAPRGILR